MPIDPDKLPTWAEFLFLAQKQGVNVVERRLPPQGKPGPDVPVRYLRRAGQPVVIVPALKPRDVLSQGLMAGLCRRLQVDPEPLGISLDDLPPEEWPSPE
jgi:hypothetical protein